jgi:hypothetical protein
LFDSLCIFVLATFLLPQAPCNTLLP